MRTRATLIESLLAQSAALLTWLRALPTAEFARPTVLDGWDTRALTGHLLLMELGLSQTLDRPSQDAPPAAYEFVARYRGNAAAIEALTVQTAVGRSGPELVAALAETDLVLQQSLSANGPAVLQARFGPVRREDWIATRLLELVVHSDDLNRSFPDLPPVLLPPSALDHTVRLLARMLAEAHPGRSVEVRVPPIVAIQCGLGDTGPTHTRGTPPNVIETDPLTFLRLATGRTEWAGNVANGTIRASGLRADLTPVLPLLS